MEVVALLALVVAAYLGFRVFAGSAARREALRQANVRGEYVPPVAEKVTYRGEVEGEEIRTKVVGVTKPNPRGRPRQMVIAELTAGDQLALARDPNNPHDPNAVMVFTRAGEQIGYLRTELAADLAPVMDAGHRWGAEVLEVTGGTRHKPTRGVNIRIVVTDEPVT
ncbi:MAG: HIRAN domain-containing protein [Alphaproteobacteria bacterium]